MQMDPEAKPAQRGFHHTKQALKQSWNKDKEKHDMMMKV